MFSGLCLKADARRLWLDRFSVFDFFLVQNLQRARRDRAPRTQRRCGMIVGRWSTRCGTLECWQQPELPAWEVPKRDPHERRPRAPDWTDVAAAEISELPAASDDATGGDIAA